MDAPDQSPDRLLVPALPAGWSLSRADVAALLAHQRMVSGLVADLHRCLDKPARRAVLARIADEAVRGEVESIFLPQWRRIKESKA